MANHKTDPNDFNFRKMNKKRIVSANASYSETLLVRETLAIIILVENKRRFYCVRISAKSQVLDSNDWRAQANKCRAEARPKNLLMKRGKNSVTIAFY